MLVLYVIKLNRINETNKITLKMTMNAHILKFGFVISLSLVLNNLEWERAFEIMKSIEDLDQRFTLRSCISGQLQMVVVEDFAFLDDCRPVFVQDLPQSLHREGCRGMWRRTGWSAIINDNKTRVRAQTRRVDCRSFDEALCANACLRSLPNVMTHARFQVRRNWPKHSRKNLEETRC